jgi:hypothetical protein
LIGFGQLVLEKKIFVIKISVFLLFCNYLPLERGNPLHLYKLKFPSPKDDLYQVWLKLVQWFWRRRFLNDSTQFDIFAIISPLKRTWPFIWTSLNFLFSRIMCTKFDWIWGAGSGEKDLKKISVYFYCFAIISSWRGAMPYIWTNLKIFFTQGWFMPSLVEIGPVVLEKKIFKWPHPIFFYNFVIISP